MSETQLMMVRVPPKLKTKIARAVKRAELSMNDVVVKILADHYGAEFEQVGRSVAKPIGDSPSVVLKLPSGLHAAIDADAKSMGDSMRNRVVEVLSDHFEVPYVPTARWPKTATA